MAGLPTGMMVLPSGRAYNVGQPIRPGEVKVNTKLFLQILLLLGCLAVALGLVDAVLAKRIWLTSQGWWRGAIACWVLLIAVRTVYPAQAK
jgi:hypothetical protein